MFINQKNNVSCVENSTRKQDGNKAPASKIFLNLLGNSFCFQMVEPGNIIVFSQKSTLPTVV